MRGEGTEVVYRQTVDTSIEIGTPKDGRIKFALTEEEVADAKLVERKIDRLAVGLEYARQRLLKGK